MNRAGNLPVKVQQVDVVRAETLERFLHGRFHVFGITVDHPVRLRHDVEAKLCGQEDFRTFSGTFEPGKDKVVA